jgi:hypothetical protein
MRKEMRKNVISIAILIFISISGFVFAQRVRPARYTLKDLSDPNSPSFVPYPFPKNDFEILEDFKYSIKKMRLYEEPGYDIFLLERKDVSVDRIFKVEQKCMDFPHDYYYLFQVRQNGEIVGEQAVDEFGLVMTGTLFETPEEKSWAKTYKDRNDVETLVDKALGGNKIKKMDLVYRISDICKVLCPMWEVETDEGRYFVDYLGAIWTTDYETPISQEKISTRTKKAVLDEEKHTIKILKKVNAK